MEHPTDTQEKPDENPELEALIASELPAATAGDIPAPLALPPGQGIADNLLQPVGEVLALVMPATGGYIVDQRALIAGRLQAVADKYGWDLTALEEGVPPELMLIGTLIPLYPAIREDMAAIRKAMEPKEPANDGNAQAAA